MGTFSRSLRMRFSWETSFVAWVAALTEEMAAEERS